MKSLKNIREASGGKEAYMKFFNSLLKKFGADSPSELKGDKKTKFFNALDKGWDGDNEKDEALTEKLKAKPGKFSGRGKDYFEIDIVIPDKWKTDEAYYKAVLKKYKVKLEYIGGGGTEYMHKASGKKSDILAWGLGKSNDGIGYGVDETDIADYFDISQELYVEGVITPKVAKHTIRLVYEGEIKEKLRGGRGKLGPKDALDIDLDASDFKGGEKAFIKFASTKFKIKIKPTRVGAEITGDKAKILAFLQSDDYGMDDSDIKALFPELMENKDDFKDDTDVEDDRGNYSGVEEDHSLRHDDDDDEDMDDLDPDTTTDLQGEDYYDSKQEKAPPGMEDFVEKLKADGKTDEEAFAIAWSQYNDAKRTKTRHGDAEHESVEEAKWGPAKKGKTIRGGKLGKSYPVMDAGQKSKVQAIAKKNSGNMQQAMIDIEKIRGGLTDNPDVMEILRIANESVEEARKVKPVQGNKKEYWRRVDAVRKKFGILGKEGGILNLNKAAQKKYFAAVDAALGHTLEDLDLQGTGDAGTSKSVTEKVSVDRRTKGFKEAMIRKEKAKAKREAKKAREAKTPKFNTDAHIDKGNYEYDGEVEEVIKRTSDMVMYGKRKEDAAANAVAHAGVDMAPNAKPKKKKLSDIYKR